MAKSASAIRSAKWRANQKKKGTARKAKSARKPRAAAAAPAAGDRASVKAQGKDGVKTVFVTTTVSLAQRAFRLLLADVQANAEAPENAGIAPDVQRIVNRLGA